MKLDRLSFEVPYPPSANKYWRVFRGRAVKSVEARNYALSIRALWPRDVPPAIGPVAVTLDVVRPSKRGDLDNSAKVILDALQGLAYLNDSQIVELHMYRSDNKKAPCVVVTIEERNE